MTKSSTEQCECINWCRSLPTYPKLKAREGAWLVTNHHPNCEHYNDSLMDVWKVTVAGRSCYVDNEQDANDSVGDNGTIIKEKMHREIFENLADFEGF